MDRLDIIRVILSSICPLSIALNYCLFTTARELKKELKAHDVVSRFEEKGVTVSYGDDDPTDY